MVVEGGAGVPGEGVFVHFVAEPSEDGSEALEECSAEGFVVLLAQDVDVLVVHVVHVVLQRPALQDFGYLVEDVAHPTLAPVQSNLQGPSVTVLERVLIERRIEDALGFAEPGGGGGGAFAGGALVVLYV